MITDKKQFIRSKPNLSVCTMGHVDHGKTTLTSAITYVLSKKGEAEFYEYKQIDRTPEERERKITISVFITEYSTNKYHVIHSDAPGHSDFVKNATIGFSQVDNGILVVAFDDGTKPQTKEHLNLSKRVGIQKLIVCFTKIDTVEDQMTEDSIEMQRELLKEEVEEQAIAYGYKKEDLLFLDVYSLLALQDDERGINSIRKLIECMDNHFVRPTPEVDKPFLMSVESKYNIKGRGTVVAGRVSYGKIVKGDKLSLVGLGTNIPVKVLDLEMFKKTLNEVYAGDNPGVLLSTTAKFQEGKCPIRGQSLIQPNSYKVYKKFKAQIYILTQDEGGRNRGFGVGYQPTFFIRTASVTGTIVNMSTINTNESVDFVKTGDFVIISVELESEVILTGQENIIMREGNKTVSSGKIIELLK